MTVFVLGLLKRGEGRVESIERQSGIAAERGDLTGPAAELPGEGIPPDILLRVANEPAEELRQIGERLLIIVDDIVVADLQLIAVGIRGHPDAGILHFEGSQLAVLPDLLHLPLRIERPEELPALIDGGPDLRELIRRILVLLEPDEHLFVHRIHQHVRQVTVRQRPRGGPGTILAGLIRRIEPVLKHSALKHRSDGVDVAPVGPLQRAAAPDEPAGREPLILAGIRRVDFRVGESDELQLRVAGPAELNQRGLGDPALMRPAAAGNTRPGERAQQPRRGGSSPGGAADPSAHLRGPLLLLLVLVVGLAFFLLLAVLVVGFAFLLLLAVFVVGLALFLLLLAVTVLGGRAEGDSKYSELLFGQSGGVEAERLKPGEEFLVLAQRLFGLFAVAVRPVGAILITTTCRTSAAGRRSALGAKNVKFRHSKSFHAGRAGVHHSLRNYTTAVRHVVPHTV